LGVIVTRHAALRTTLHTFDELSSSAASMISKTNNKQLTSSSSSASSTQSSSRLFQKTRPWNIGKPLDIEVIEVIGTCFLSSFFFLLLSHSFWFVLFRVRTWIGGEDEAAAATITQSHQPFDLSNDLMIRATVIRYQVPRGYSPSSHSDHTPSSGSRSGDSKTGKGALLSPNSARSSLTSAIVMENRELLLIVAHHSAFDGASIGSLLNEFTIMWNHFIHTPMPPASPSGAIQVPFVLPSLPSLPVSYIDYSKWEIESHSLASMKASKEW
jgi:hypothetical protein